MNTGLNNATERGAHWQIFPEFSFYLFFLPKQLLPVPDQELIEAVN